MCWLSVSIVLVLECHSFKQHILLSVHYRAKYAVYSFADDSSRNFITIYYFVLWYAKVFKLSNNSVMAIPIWFCKCYRLYRNAFLWIDNVYLINKTQAFCKHSFNGFCRRKIPRMTKKQKRMAKLVSESEVIFNVSSEQVLLQIPDSPFIVKKRPRGWTRLPEAWIYLIFVLCVFGVTIYVIVWKLEKSQGEEQMMVHARRSFQ